MDRWGPGRQSAPARAVMPFPFGGRRCRRRRPVVLLRGWAHKVARGGDGDGDGDGIGAALFPRRRGSGRGPSVQALAKASCVPPPTPPRYVPGL
jgi:hypothetical protein